MEGKEDNKKKVANNLKDKKTERQKIERSQIQEGDLVKGHWPIIVFDIVMSGQIRTLATFF